MRFAGKIEKLTSVVPVIASPAYSTSLTIDRNSQVSLSGNVNSITLNILEGQRIVLVLSNTLGAAVSVVMPSADWGSAEAPSAIAAGESLILEFCKLDGDVYAVRGGVPSKYGLILNQTLTDLVTVVEVVGLREVFIVKTAPLFGGQPFDITVDVDGAYTTTVSQLVVEDATLTITIPEAGIAKVII